MRTYFSNAQFAVCGRHPDGGGGVLFWHTDYAGAEDDMNDMNERGGFAYVVEAPNGEIDERDEYISRAQALAKVDAVKDPMRVKPYPVLTSYKCYNKTDMIDLIRVTLNEYWVSDRDYNRIILMVINGSRDIYTDDLKSSVKSLVKMQPEQLEQAWQSYLKDRNERVMNRLIFRNIIRMVTGR